MQQVRVESYAGYKGEQEPRFVWIDERREEVLGIRDRWYDPGGDVYKVRTESGLLLLLRYDRSNASWWLLQSETTDG